MSQTVSAVAPPKESFDKKFVFAAVLIGTAYTVIVVMLGVFIGKEAAGIAGVALTALSTGIFKQFETLRFRRQADASTTSIELPAFRIWYFLLILFAFIGVQVILGAILASVMLAFGFMPDLTNPETLVNIFSDTKVLILLVVLSTVGYFLSGYMIGKTAPSVTYTYAIVAAFLANVVPLLLQIIPLLIIDWSFIKILVEPSIYIAGVFWLLYVIAALIGAKLGFRKNIPRRVIAANQPDTSNQPLETNIQ